MNFDCLNFWNIWPRNWLKLIFAPHCRSFSVLISGYDKVSKHASIACRQLTDFVGKESKKKDKNKINKKFKYQNSYKCLQMFYLNLPYHKVMFTIYMQWYIETIYHHGTTKVVFYIFSRVHATLKPFVCRLVGWSVGW